MARSRHAGSGMHPGGNLRSLQRLAGNAAVSGRLSTLGAFGTLAAQGVALRQVTMKDIGLDHPRTDGNTGQFEGEVDQTIADNDYDDLNETIKQLTISINSRQLLAVKNAATWRPEKKESEEFRLNREIAAIERIRTARDNHNDHAAVVAARDAKKAAAAAKKKAGGWAEVGKGGRANWE